MKLLALILVMATLATGAFILWQQRSEKLRTREYDSFPLADVVVLDCFYSKDKTHYSCEGQIHPLANILFVDYLSRPHNAHLGNLAKKMAIQRVSEAGTKEVISKYLKDRFLDVKQIRADNLVFINSKNEVVFSVVGGSHLVSTDYHGEDARDKSIALIKDFLESLK
jgi:hypothetical protein